jgi:hypothetical protein
MLHGVLVVGSFLGASQAHERANRTKLAILATSYHLRGLCGFRTYYRHFRFFHSTVRTTLSIRYARSLKWISVRPVSFSWKGVFQNRAAKKISLYGLSKAVHDSSPVHGQGTWRPYLKGDALQQEIAQFL